jgi:hypothetical protein
MLSLLFLYHKKLKRRINFLCKKFKLHFNLIYFVILQAHLILYFVKSLQHVELHEARK